MKDGGGNKKTWILLLLVGVVLLGGQWFWPSSPIGQREQAANSPPPGVATAEETAASGSSRTEPVDYPGARTLSESRSRNEDSLGGAASVATEDAGRDAAALPAPAGNTERAMVTPSVDIILPTKMVGKNGEIVDAAVISIPNTTSWAAAQNDGILRLARGEKPHFIRREPRLAWERAANVPVQGERAEEQR